MAQTSVVLANVSIVTEPGYENYTFLLVSIMSNSSKLCCQGIVCVCMLPLMGKKRNFWRTHVKLMLTINWLCSADLMSAAKEINVIDERAIVDPSAQIAESVSIGPGAIIGPNVKIDEGTTIGPYAVVKGPTVIGKHNKIFQFASIGDEPQDVNYDGEDTRLEIGDHNTIREYCMINRGTLKVAV